MNLLLVLVLLVLVLGGGGYAYHTSVGVGTLGGILWLVLVVALILALLGRL